MAQAECVRRCTTYCKLRGDSPSPASLDTMATVFLLGVIVFSVGAPAFIEEAGKKNESQTAATAAAAPPPLAAADTTIGSNDSDWVDVNEKLPKTTTPYLASTSTSNAGQESSPPLQNSRIPCSALVAQAVQLWFLYLQYCNEVQLMGAVEGGTVTWTTLRLGLSGICVRWSLSFFAVEGEFVFTTVHSVPALAFIVWLCRSVWWVQVDDLWRPVFGL